MLFRLLGKNRVGWWVAVTFAALLLVAACGGPKNEESNTREQSASGASGGQVAGGQGQAQSGSNQGSTASNQPGQGAGSGGGQSGQASGNEGQTSSSSIITGVDACASFSWLGQTGAGGFKSQWGDGYQVNASKSPPSDFAANVAKFAEESLEDVLDGDVSAECFYESKVTNTGGVYVALSLPGTPPSGVASSVGEAMRKRGGNVLGAYSSTSPEGTFDIVSLQQVPVDSPSGAPATGALYFMNTQEGVFQAVMLANYTDISSQVMPGMPSVPAAPSSTQAPLPARTVAAVVPSGTAGSINDDLEPALEKALGVSLVVENYFQNTSGGNNTVLITYHIEGGVPSSADLSKGISDALEDLDGTISFAFAGPEGTTVAFEGLKAGGFTVGGGATYVPSNNQLSITLTSVSS